MMPLRTIVHGRDWKRRRYRVGKVVIWFLLATLIFSCVVLLSSLVVRFFTWTSEIGTIKDVKERLTIENEIYRTLGQIFGGSVLLVGLYFTWRNFRLGQEGQITDRLHQAIEHLGSSNEEVLLGGIYQLARIAQDSPKDHWAVVQIFCAYLRRRERSIDAAVSAPARAILVLLSARRIDYEAENQFLDFRGADLSGAELSGGNFEKALFDDARLVGADLTGARLCGASFRGADLQAAILRRADLTAALLTSADLRNSSLRDANLCQADLFGTRLADASLIGADLTGAFNALRGELELAITDDHTSLPEYLVIAGISE